jgi:hypothetical protein
MRWMVEARKMAVLRRVRVARRPAGKARVRVSRLPGSRMSPVVARRR